MTASNAPPPTATPDTQATVAAHVRETAAVVAYLHSVETEQAPKPTRTPTTTLTLTPDGATQTSAATATYTSTTAPTATATETPAALAGATGSTGGQQIGTPQGANPLAVNLFGALVAGAFLAMVFAARWLYRHPDAWEMVKVRVVDLLGFELVETKPPPGTVIDAEVLFNVNVDGERRRLTQQEYWEYNWRLWLRRLWIVWQHMSFKGRDFVMDRCTVRRDDWDTGMDYFQRWGLAKVDRGRVGTVPLVDQDVALDRIKNAPLVPIVRRPAPERIMLHNPLSVVNAPPDDARAIQTQFAEFPET